MVALPTKVSVSVGSVIVPVLVIVEITGAVNVLFVNVCIWSLKTNTSLPVNNGNVTVRSSLNSLTPKIYWWFELVSFIWGAVNVLFVNVKEAEAISVPLIFKELTSTAPPNLEAPAATCKA